MVNDFLRKAKDFLLGRNDAEDIEYPDRPRPASEDPYGDPGDPTSYPNVRPASEDPYGDPGDPTSYRNVRPASKDPYGDPADEDFPR